MRPIVKKLLFAALLVFAIAPSAGAADQPNLSSTALTPQETANRILDNLSRLNYEKRKEKFESFLGSMQSIKDLQSRDLFVARLFLIYRGENDSNVQRAISLAENYLKLNPTSSDALCVLASSDQAQLSMDTVFKNPSEWKNSKDLALRELALRRIAEALAINNKCGEAYRIKAELSEGEDKIELFEKSIELSPNDAESWRGLVDELMVRKRYDEAISKLSSWCEQKQSLDLSIELNMRFGKVYREKKEYKKAISRYEKALEARKDSKVDGLDTIYAAIDDIYLGLGQTCLDSDDSKGAESWLSAYLAINPKACYVRFKLAHMYQKINESDKAIVQYEQVLAYEKDNDSSIFNLALIYKDKEPNEAKKLFLKYLELNLEADSEEAKEWSDKAKEHLRSLGVYTYPKSKKELVKEVEEQKRQETRSAFGYIIGIGVLGLVGVAGAVGWRFRVAIMSGMRYVILTLMVLATVFICIVEAESYAPSVGKAILCLIPVGVIGSFLLYIFRKR